MTRRSLPGLAPFLLALPCALASSCAGPSPLEPRVVRGLDDEPLRGADVLVVSVEQRGVLLDAHTLRVPLPATSFVLSGVPLGTDLALRVEAFAGDVVLARGHSWPFDYEGSGAMPASPDVLLATLGRFTRTLETSEVIVALAPGREGAVLVTREGNILRYLAHGGLDGAAILEPGVRVAAREGAAWAIVDDTGGAPALLGVGGVDDGASLIDGTGALVAELAPTGRGPLHGVALVASSEGGWALAVGGEDGAGRPLASLTRYTLEGATLTRTELMPLTAPRVEAALATVPVDLGGSPSELVLVAGGGAATTVLVDPSSGPRGEVMLEPALEARAWVAVENGLVVAAGGLDAAGVASDAVDLYLVRPEHEVPIARVTPAPNPLFAPRAHALALRLGPGLALFASGRDTTLAPVRGGELVEVRLDALPGDVVPTGSLPLDVRGLAMTRLSDHSVLLVGEGVVAAYVPPRGPD